MRVMMDLFSGRPNPAWRLSPAQARQVADKLAALTTLHAAQIAPEYIPDAGLGFRGFVIERELGDPPAPPGIPSRLRVAPTPIGGRRFASEPEVADMLLAWAAEVVGPVLVEAAVSKTAVMPAATAARPREMSRSRRSKSKAAEPSEAASEVMAGREIEIAREGVPFLTPYQPEFWNTTSIRFSNNCYNYAVNFASNTVAQPGRGAGTMYTAFTCDAVWTAASADGVVAEITGIARVVALAIWPGMDFHWWRLHPNGMWAHKLGLSTARNFDNSGSVIAGGLTPASCDRQPYTEFCGYFFVPLGVWVR